MLHFIRERAQGWIAWVIVGLLIIPFALWGIQSYLGIGGEPVVAKVDGTKITERQLDQNVQRTRMQLRERLGGAYNPNLFESGQLRAQVLERMIRDTVLLDASYGMGMRVSDEAVRAAILTEPAFQRDGVFDKDTYERVLELQGMTPMAYEERLRNGLLSTQLSRAVTESGFTTGAELAAATRLLRQQRDIAYLVLPRDGFVPDAEPSAGEIQAYYDANQQRFQSPERVKLSYIVLDADALAKPAKVDEATLRAAYQERIDEFQEPERRDIRHILLTLPADASDAKAQKVKDHIAELRAKIEAGADFAAVAKANSEDPLSAAKGGDLGMVERGMMDPAFEQAAFALKQGVISEPVRSRFGYHLIEVTKVEGGKPKPFEQVRDQLARELGRSDAEKNYFELAEQLANLTYESPDSLIPAAEALGLKVQTSDWIERGGGEGILANPKVTAAAFSEDVLEQGNNSELIEPDPDRMQSIVVRVDEHEPAAVRALDDVRDEIVQTLKQQQASTAALKAAEAMAKRLRGGEKLAAVAAEAKPEPAAVNEPGKVTRNQQGVPPTVLDLAFNAPRPAEGAASYATGQEPNGDALVVVVRAVEDGDSKALKSAQRDAERQILTRVSAEHSFDAVLDDLVARAKIERKKLSSEEP